MSPRTVTIVVKHEFDQDSDPLPDSPANVGSFWDSEDTAIHETEEQRQEVRDRIEAWKRDEWYYLGVVVRVAVTFPYRVITLNRGTIEREAHDTETCSLWGIESDSGEEYFLSTAQELLGDALHELGLPPAHVGLIDKAEGTWELPPF